MGQTDRQTDRQTDGRTDGQTDRQGLARAGGPDRQTDRQTDGRTDRQGLARAGGPDRQTDRQTDRQISDMYGRQESFNDHLSPHEKLSLEHLFSCEIDDRKRAWSFKFCPMAGAVINDISDLGKSIAHCRASDKFMPVKRCFLFVFWGQDRKLFGDVLCQPQACTLRRSKRSGRDPSSRCGDAGRCWPGTPRGEQWFGIVRRYSQVHI